MSVLLVTSLGDIVVDLHTDLCPLTCKNFLKLCKIKYYNSCLFHTVQKDFTAQTGDPTGTGAGGDSIYKFLYGDQARFFGDEIRLELKHNKIGTVAMASAGEDLNASQFYITLRDDLDYLDGKHTVFGEVAEGLETLQRINEAYVDVKGRPYKNIRIKHTYILEDPFDDPAQLAELIPDASPEGKPKDEVDEDVRLEDDWVPIDEQLGSSELEEVLRTKNAHSSAVVLESIGDIPDAEVKPPDNVLFVCKLNPVTEDEDLHTIFSRFGTVTSADIIRDYKTGDSLCYAFIEFESTEACEQAYFKSRVGFSFLAFAWLGYDSVALANLLAGCVCFPMEPLILLHFFLAPVYLPVSMSGPPKSSLNRLAVHRTMWLCLIRLAKMLYLGKGCFKCGAPDHIAKDCAGDPSIKQQPSKYILKDNNSQRGGDVNSRYDMVFDEESARSPHREKKRRDYGLEDHMEKHNGEHRSAEDLKPREYEKSHDRYRDSSTRSREFKEHERNRESRTTQSRQDFEYHDKRRDIEKYKEKRGHTDDDKRDDRDYRRRSADGVSSGDRRSERDYRKRNAEDNSRGDGRDGEGHKRLNGDNNRRDKRDESSYQRMSADSDGRKDNREERDHRKRSREIDDERDRDRRHRGDGRR
ncbi:cytochrome P450 monooxygenase 59 [Sarracenia purpurea var. burkii]